VIPSLNIPVSINLPLNDEPALLISGRTLHFQNYEYPDEPAIVIDEGDIIRSAFLTKPGLSLTDAINRTEKWLDILKLPHHGSKSNVTANLLAVAPAEHYIVSTNGERFHHPDDIALARVVTNAKRQPTIWFNYASEAARRWSDPALQAKYGFSTRQPDDASGSGIHINLPEVQR